IETKFLNLITALEAYHRIRIKRSAKLNKRLELLFEKFAHIAKLMVEDMDKFVKDLELTRNRIAHGEDKINSSYVEPKELFRKSEILRVMCQGIILCELGFAENHITEMIKRVPVNWFILRN